MTTQTLENPAAGGSHRPPAVLRAVRWFRLWRKRRPFPAGLLITLAGIELWLAPYSSIGVMIHEGIAGFSAVFIGALLVMFGMTVWFAPAYRTFAGIAAILLGLIALPTVNLGGFFLGTLLALIGGALAASWVPRPGWEAPTRGERRRIRRATRTQEVPTAAPSEAHVSEIGITEHPATTASTVAEQELAALEARVGEPNTARPEASRPGPTPFEQASTVYLPEVENPGATAAERPEG